MPNFLPLLPDYQPPREPWLDIIYQDKDLLVVNKPSGLLSTPGRDPSLNDSVLSRAKSLSPYIELVHRLDLDTSGVLLLSKRKKAERFLKIQFQERETRKVYRAWVWGRLPAPEGEIDLPLAPDRDRRPLHRVCHETGKPSLTRYRVLQQEADRSLVELYPLTGRSHQLRVHLLSLGCPILGDRFYAEGAALAASPRLLLHAVSLEIRHPYTGTQMIFTAPCPF